MRVLIATDSFPPGCGGSGWSTYELARGLRAVGHDVQVVHARVGAPGDGDRSHEDFVVRELAVAAPRLPFVRNYYKNERSYRLMVPRLCDIIRATRADVVHAQHVLTAPPAVEAASIEGVPVVCTVRDYWPLCYWSDLIHDPASSVLCPGCTKAMMKRCIRPRAGRAWPLAVPLTGYMAANLRRKRLALARAGAVIAVSRTLANDLANRAPELASTRLETIPNPVDVAAIGRAACAPHPLDGRPYAIYAGKLARNKGIASLLPAVERARLPWPLAIVGDGPEREAVVQAARHARRDVRLLGWLPRDEALTWMAHASVVVFPSYGPESLSRVLLEASVLGRPIAAMDTGGTRDIIVDGDTGLLARSADDLGDAVHRLVSDRSLAETLGGRAAAFVTERFATARVVARIEALYADLLNGKEAGRG